MNARVAVIGSRSMTTTTDNVVLVEHSLDKLCEEHHIDEIIEIISGGARGADTLAEIVARNKDIPLTVFSAHWEVYGKSAGYRRNRDIINNATHVLAFWDGQSKGTKHSIDLAEKNNKPILVISL